MFYGCRTKRTLSIPDVWYEVNAACGRNLIVAGVLVAILAGLSPLVVPALGAGLITALMVVALLSAVLAAFLLANRSYRP